MSTILNAQVNVTASPSNTINTVTKEELSNLYLGKTDKIKEKKVKVINNNEDYDEFNKKVLDKNQDQIHAYWMKQIFLGKKIPPKKMARKDIQNEINRDNNIIGYSSKELNGKVIYETK